MSAVAFFFAPNFAVVLITNVGVGTGIAMVTSMAYSLIGEFYPLEKRGRAIGWIVAATTLAYVIGAPVIGVLASIGSWRTVMILLALPVALASLILALFVIPKKSNRNAQLRKNHSLPAANKPSGTGLPLPSYSSPCLLWLKDQSAFMRFLFSDLNLP